MTELLRLLNSLGGASDLFLGAGIAWVLFEVRLMKARAKEDRQRNEADHARLFKEVGEVKTMVGEVKTMVGEVKTEVGEVKTEVGEVKTEVGGLKTEVGGLKTKVGGLKTKVEILLDRSDRKDSDGGAG